MNPMLPPMQMGADMGTVDMALRQRAQANHAPDVPQVTDDMNPYFMETGTPPGKLDPMQASRAAMSSGMQGGMSPPDMGGAMGGGAEGPEGAGPAGPGVMSSDQAAMMRDVLMQRVNQQSADSDAYQGQAESQNQQSALKRKQMGV